MKQESIVLKVDGEDKTYKLKPLAWEDFPKLFGLVNKFQGTKEEDMLEVLDENTIKSLMDLEYKMFKKSYPELKDDEIKQIVQLNLFDLMTVMFKVNLEK